MSRGLLYIVRNPLFPTLFKIGFTTKASVEDRGLNSANLPEEFEVLRSFECNDAKKKETVLHEQYDEFRYISQRGKKTEFFASACLKKALAFVDAMQDLTDITEEIQDTLEQKEEDEEKNTPELYDKSKVFSKRPMFNFSEMGIPIGAFLEFVTDPQIKVKVINDRQVKFKSKIQFLSSLTAKLLKTKRRRVRPTPHWKYEGKTLSVIYTETH